MLFNILSINIKEHQTLVKLLAMHSHAFCKSQFCTAHAQTHTHACIRGLHK